MLINKILPFLLTEFVLKARQVLFTWLQSTESTRHGEATIASTNAIHNYHIPGLNENLEYQTHRQFVKGSKNSLHLTSIPAQNYTIPAADDRFPELQRTLSINVSDFVF